MTTEPKGQARQLALASLGQAAATVWSALVGFFTAPFLLHHLGTSSYGVFALIGLVSSYLFNLEFGFGHANIRFLAHARASGNAEAEAAVLGNSLLIFLPAAVVGLLLTFFGAPFIVQHFAHAPHHLRATFVVAIRLGAIQLALNILTTVWQSSLQALGRLRLIVASGWISGTALSAVSVGVALSGGGLVPILEAQLAVYAMLCLFLFQALSRETAARLVPRLDRATFRQMARFAGFSVLAGLAAEVLVQGPALVLAAYAGTAALAALSVPRAVLAQLDNVIGSSSLGFLPFTSAASADPDHSRVKAIYIANMRLTLLIMAPVTCFLAAFAHPLLVAWIGRSFAAKAAVPLQFLAGASLFLGLGGAPADTARGFNRPHLVTIYTAAAAAVTLGLSFFFIPSHHAAGAAIALCFGGAVTTIPFLFLVARYVLAIPVLSLARSLRGPLLALVCVGLVDVVGVRISKTLVGAIVTGVAATAAYSWVISRFVIDERERAVLASVFRRFGRAGRAASTGR